MRGAREVSPSVAARAPGTGHDGPMPATVAPGKRRVYAVAGVGTMIAGRWHDADDDARLEGWIRAGLVQERGPHGEDAPERIRRGCCGDRR